MPDTLRNPSVHTFSCRFPVELVARIRTHLRMRSASEGVELTISDFLQQETKGSELINTVVQALLIQ